MISVLQEKYQQLLHEHGRKWHERPVCSVPVRANSSDRIAARLDLTLLKPDATAAAYESLASEARDLGCCSICVPPNRVAVMRAALKDSGVKICTVIGFPLGFHIAKAKAFEAERALADGADEFDMVISISAAKEAAAGNQQQVINMYDDVAAVVQAVQGRMVKVIIETALLDIEEKKVAALVAAAAGAGMIKTSTGFSHSGAQVEDIVLLRRVLGDAWGIKASGGIRSKEDAMAMIAAGADRIGASAGRALIA